MELTDDQVLEALDELRGKHLVFEVSGSRVRRYEHNAPKGLNLPGASVALLSTLMLRGPQTAAELRQNTERLHKFADISSVQAFLDEMAEKPPARVRLLPKAPGAREARWAHLLAGEPPAEAYAGAGSASPAAADSSELAALRDEVATLRSDVEQLKVELASLKAQLGA